MWLRTPKQIVQSQMRVPCNMILTTKLFTILNRILEGTAHVTPYQPQPQIVFLRSEFCGTCNSPCPNLPKPGGGKVSPRESVVQLACQYDVTSRLSDFQNGEKCSSKRRIKILILGTGQKVWGGGGGPEHLEMWLIKNTWPTPPFGTKMTDPPLKQGWKLHDPPPS